MTDVELLACATTFTLKHMDFHANLGHIRELKVEMRHPNPEAWAIIGDSCCLNRDGEWEYEPAPSSRSEDFFARTRWPNARTAIAAAEQHMARYPTGYKPDC
jgi:hypothetical protein